MKWNNTGIYKDFACTIGTTHIPENFKIAAQNNLWKIYEVSANVYAAIHSSQRLSVLALFKNQNPNKLAEELLKFNPEIDKLHTQFQFPGGNKIEYDVNAPNKKWVITAIDNIPTEGDFDKWPLISGNL